MKKYLFIVLSAMLMSGCVSHYGLVNNVNQNQTNVQLSENNFKVVKRVSGFSQTSYFLGIGGFNKQGLIAEARRNMLNGADLIGNSKAVINENIEYQTKLIFPFTQVKVIASAFIVEFINKSDSVKTAFQPNKYESFSDVVEDIDDYQMISSGGVTGGLHFSPYFNYGSIFGGFKTELSWPEMSKGFFFEPNLMFDYIPGLERFNISVPLYVGYKVPFTKKVSAFGKAGLLLNFNATDSYMDTPGLGLQSGLQFGKKIQTFIGFDVYAEEYISGLKVGVAYSF